MRKIFFLFCTQILFTHSLQSQDTAMMREKWVVNPAYHTTASKYIYEPAYVVLDKRRIEYIDDPANNITEYYTQHKIIHVNDDHGIEYFNKIYIQVNDYADIVEIKARTILPEGKIIELEQGNIKNQQDDDGTLYKIFAMEGLEKGCEVEYSYTIRRETSYFGKITIQDKFPVLETNFELISPDRLVFDTKLYNCNSTSATDSLPNEKLALRINFKEMPGLEEEKYSSYRVNLARIEYKLSYNNATHRGERLFTWNELSKKIFAMYTSYSEKDVKKTADFVTDNKWENLSTAQEKIITVENYIKKNFAFRNDLDGPDVNNLEKILKTRMATSIGLMRLYGVVFKILSVPCQFVLTADRDDILIDKTFENWDNCDFPILYFPIEKKFLAPTKSAFRYPYIFPSWGEANALFCKNISIGSMNSAIAEIKMVPLEDYRNTYSLLESGLKLNATMDTLLVDMKMSYAGYMAAYYRESFNYLTPEQKKTAIKDIIKQFIGSETILFSELGNIEYENVPNAKPFILHTKVNSGDLLERAGNKLLLKIGLVIGPQVEMYQEKQRRLPIKMEYGHYEQRKIEFTIPDGYSIKNPEDLKIEQVYKENGIQTMGFVSGYEIKGNQLTVEIMEDYRKTDYPISQYEEFKKIINASSDFNKVVLILVKK